MRRAVSRVLPVLVLVLGGILGGPPDLPVSARAAVPAPQPGRASEARLRRDVTYLASDLCEGRGPTTRGLRRAGDYVAAEFRKAGLKPGGTDGSYFQTFTLRAAFLEGPARLALRGPLGQEVVLKEGVQFWPMGLGRTGRVTAPVVFAGYGITGPGGRYDDYAGLDVAGKVVVVFRGTPRGGGGELRAMAPLVRKLANAQKHRAAAVLFVNDAATARDGDGLLDFNYTALGRTETTLPAFHVRRSVLEAMLQNPDAYADPAALEGAIDRDLKPHSFALEGWTVRLDLKVREGQLPLNNVVGVLDGAGPLARETVVVGAHYDHLGYGGAGGSLSGSRKMAIHHGADDNASGTTALMELARRFAAEPHPPRAGGGRGGWRRLVFIAFSGEELGLLGSEHYCKKPLFPLADTAAMFNLDMVGRLRPDKDTGRAKLLTEGSGTAKPFAGLLDELAGKYDFKMVNKASGFGPSDHASFCGKKVPVLFFWTGDHPDYHRPSDTADKINVAGMRRVVDLSAAVVTYLATLDPRPAFVEVKAPRGFGARDVPRLGFRPSYDDEGEGVLLGGIAEGGPADKAGLREGDRIVAVAGKPVKNLLTYMQVMSTQKKGTTIEILALRGGKEQGFKVKLE
jgi:hypothetical protein